MRLFLCAFIIAVLSRNANIPIIRFLAHSFCSFCRISVSGNCRESKKPSGAWPRVAAPGGLFLKQILTEWGAAGFHAGQEGVFAFIAVSSIPSWAEKSFSGNLYNSLDNVRLVRDAFVHRVLNIIEIKYVRDDALDIDPSGRHRIDRHGIDMTVTEHGFEG